ncbi:MAG TPA: response regulator transcription factor [Trebonia sp.]|jgi:DNA-binding NarL/FixJ family response regulator
MTIRVLIVDDQPLVRAGLRTLLRAQEGIEVVGEASTGAGAVDESARLTPDVVVMDIRMPGTDGIAATAQVVRQPAMPRVLVLTTYDTDEYVYDALAAGASGFLLKDAKPEDLIDGVRVVAAGDALLAPSVTRRLIDLFVDGTRARAGRPDALLATLTEREREVFGLLARGLSNGEIAAALHVSGNTAKTHVARILAKLELRDRVHAVIFAHQSGLLP